MRVVLFHSGKELPSYLECTFKQFRLFNPTMPVYFLTDYNHLENPLFAKYSIIAVNKDEYYSEKIIYFERLFGRSSSDFWTLAATRLIYIENFMRIRVMQDVYHFENDVLIYYKLEEYNSIFKRFPGIAITIGGPDKCMTGFSFFKDAKVLRHMIDYFIHLLEDNGLEGTKRKYKLDMVNEMTLMRVYSSDADSKIIPLPTMPVSPMNINLDKFGSLFDPASWGQFIGGTQGEGPGAMPKDHYIGLFLRAQMEIHLTWVYVDHLRVPCFIYDEVAWRINNLHIHSKNLHLYLSK
jgi:hypothetical protein